MTEPVKYRASVGINEVIKNNYGFASLSDSISKDSHCYYEKIKGRVVLADARIDNRAEVEEKLLEKGIILPKDSSDAMLFYYAYKLWKTECPVHLIGDYVFVVWDEKRNELFAVRDPMGIRSFYYHNESGRFLFATEVQQILNVPGISMELFEPAILTHLCGPYGQHDWSFYKNISQLPPGHILIINNRSIIKKRLWKIDPPKKIRYKYESQYAEHFLQIFEKAVACRIERGIPVGLFLSGGLDSGSIASMLGWMQAKGEQILPVKAYCWKFDRFSDGDERHISDHILDCYHISHKFIEGDSHWPLKNYADHAPDRNDPLVFVFQPLIDITLSEARNDRIKTMIWGERGDELTNFWVYDDIGLILSGNWHKIMAEFNFLRNNVKKPIPNILKNYLILPVYKHLRWRLWHEQSPDLLIPPWLAKKAKRQIHENSQWFDSKSMPYFSNVSLSNRYQLIFSYNSMRRVSFMERQYARFGLKFADPWSDWRLAEFILSIPQYVIHTRSSYKNLTRQAMKGIIPENARSSAKKIEPRGLYDWGLKVKGRKTIEKLMKKSLSGAYSFIDEQAFQRYYSAYLSGEPDRYDMWWTISLEMWLRNIITNSSCLH